MTKLNTTAHIKNVLTKSILTLVKPAEKHEEMHAEIPQQASQSPLPNMCSFPNNVTQSAEKISSEKQPNVAIQSDMDKLKNDLATLTAKSLMIVYKSEYSAWKNAKSRSKTMQGVKGKKFDDKFVTFIGFLRLVGAKPNSDDSLDRIDPECGYVELNVRWASKQLQSENRKIVKEFEVDGKPMTLTKIANLLGIKYDALRMRLKRGDSLVEMLNNHKPSEFKIGRSAKSISECPWPNGHEKDWESAFIKEAAYLCPRTPKSRCQFYVAKCIQQLELLQAQAYGYGYEPLPKNLIQETKYWMELRADASKKLDFIIHQEQHRPSLGPSQEELDMRDALGL